mmetsp:Transcript_39858/g.48562  ORF Transcript_39858/g.48562 Transcript_39858/m.48562 type:complete len:183 (-) Transcript_39858:142-690(-)|eukprot:CAMPEP_0172509128 /NCGR_PEP_ID=MMETSP1066-20121228/217713_1 /TAXON_ID=671091 /ORGANISM="Coscinodiscus wailesii, Strain CCMP2513" /LENGTH=182 /DNA_ID=CAMNT_0013287469 /DNA_START=40 /DNA_END=588 /DNA_ORIENTATION=+
MRELKHHEKRLLRKVNLYQWKGHQDNVRVAKVMRMYHVQNREDYVAYNRIAGMAKKLAAKLKDLPPSDPYRISTTDQLLQKLYNMGLITTKKSLALIEKLNPSAICRRRLPVVMVRLRMAQSLKIAVTYVEQGQVRVGPDVVTDPAFLVTRTNEDFVTWVDSSKIKRTVAKYNDKLDDFDLL